MEEVNEINEQIIQNETVSKNMAEKMEKVRNDEHYYEIFRVSQRKRKDKNYIELETESDEISCDEPYEEVKEAKSAQKPEIKKVSPMGQEWISKSAEKPKNIFRIKYV